MRNFILGGVCLIFTACGGSNASRDENALPVDAGDVINIDVAVPKSGLNQFTDFIEDLEFIPIETDSIKIIGDIDKIIVYNNDYYVLDRWQTRSLWRIDQQGKFVNKIGRVGRGPGEFIEPTDFIVNSSGVIVLDQFSHNLLFYDHDGLHQRNVPFQFSIYEITAMADESAIFAVAGDNSRNKEVTDSEFLIIDTNGDLVSQGIKNKNRLNYTAGYRSFQHRSEVIYSRPMHDIVYSVGMDSIRERYRINIKDSPLPRDYEKVCAGDYEKFMSKYKGRYSYFSGKFLETDGHVLLFTDVLDQGRIWTIHQKNTGKTISGSAGMFTEGKRPLAKDILVLGLNNTLSCNDNEIVGYLNAHYLAHELFAKSNPELQDINEFSNPVIFRFKLKRWDVD